MPKILINEKDYTSPGAPGDYANFSVLIAGFTGRAPVTPEKAEELRKADPYSTVEADEIQPDTNGVYEFNSADDFKKTIGLKAPEIEIGTTVIHHYGNQMAYELLNMGYSIIYKPINSVEELNSEDTWEIFKDKANYDFRFITHGLLESSELAEPLTYNTAKEKLEVVEAAIKALDDIDKKVDIQLETNPDLEITIAKNDEYLLIKTTYEGFKSQTGGNGKAYASYDDARIGTKNDKESLENTIKTLLSGSITTSLINQANNCIASLAKYTAKNEADTSTDLPGRGDCIALIEIDEKKYLNTNTNKKAEDLISEAISEMSDVTSDKDKGKYCALTVPSVVYKMTIDPKKPNEFKNNTKFPGAFHYLACFMNSLKSGFAEWYAAAGYTRGVSGYTIDYTTVKLGEIAINALEPRKLSAAGPKFACNVIANFRGSYYLWGNRTAHSLDEKDLVASHFLNIRQLCTTIKKQLYVACRRFTFDPNSDTLWFNFVNAIKPTLETMKADQGIRDYKILKEKTDKKATLKAKIRIIPIEAVEDFDIEVSLEDSFGETTVNAAESL